MEDCSIHSDHEYSLAEVFAEDPYKLLDLFYNLQVADKETIRFINYEGQIFPIASFPLSLYLNAKTKEISGAAIITTSAVRDALLFNIIDDIDKVRKDTKKFNIPKKNKLIKNSLPFLMHWMDDLGLSLHEMCVLDCGNKKHKGKYEIPESLGVCKNCLENFDFKQTEAMPYDSLCSSKCRKIYKQDFINDIDRILSKKFYTKISTIISNLSTRDRWVNDGDLYIGRTKARKNYYPVYKELKQVNNELKRISKKILRKLIGSESGNNSKMKPLFSKGFNPYKNVTYKKDYSSLAQTVWYKHFSKIKSPYDQKVLLSFVQYYKLRGIDKRIVLYGMLPLNLKANSPLNTF